ncbi:MAG: LacI family DNA-binding transcriptional regulator [Planctomycetota bacterium]
MHFKGTTLQDIAENANVSKSTVSRVLNNKSVVNSETRRTVLEAMKRLGYEPNAFARGLASGRSMTVGVVTQKFGSPYFDAILQGVIQGFTGTEYSPIFADGQWDQRVVSEAIRTLLGRQIDGLILLGCELDESHMIELQGRLPMLVVGRELASWDGQCLFIDNVMAAYEATNHLIEYGHRKIAMIRGIEHHQDSIRRHEGYCRALEDAGIAVDPKLVQDGDFSAQSGVIGVSSLLARGAPFTAVFCANDMMAIGARLALHRHGLRVPDDVSLVGFDDQGESAFLTPPLTTVRQPAREMGAAAAEGLMKLMQGETCRLPKLRATLQCRETVRRRQ